VTSLRCLPLQPNRTCSVYRHTHLNAAAAAAVLIAIILFVCLFISLSLSLSLSLCVCVYLQLAEDRAPGCSIVLHLPICLSVTDDLYLYNCLLAWGPIYKIPYDLS